MRYFHLILLVVLVVGCMRSPLHKTADQITASSLKESVRGISKRGGVKQSNGLQGLSTSLIKRLKEYGVQGGWNGNQFRQVIPSVEGQRYNVVGKLEGMGKDLKKQYLLFVSSGAEGVKEEIARSAVLNLARSFKKLQPQLRRSMLFIFPASDSSGIRHWLAEASVLKTQITGVMTFDAGDIQDHNLILKGLDKNTISDVLKDEADQQKRTLSSLPVTKEDNATSNYAQFARQGIPVVTVCLPLHTAEMPDSLDFEEAAKDLRICFRATYRITNQPGRQMWKNEVPFREIRTKNFER